MFETGDRIINIYDGHMNGLLGTVTRVYDGRVRVRYDERMDEYLYYTTLAGHRVENYLALHNQVRVTTDSIN